MTFIITFKTFFMLLKTLDFLCRLGSARAVNRRYISDCVPLKIRMQASAGFVSASALGMACGPALAGILQTNFKIYNLTFNQNTLPGWVMAVAWLVYLVWLWISFQEPSHFAEENHTPNQSNVGMYFYGLYMLIIVLTFLLNFSLYDYIILDDVLFHSVLLLLPL